MVGFFYSGMDRGGMDRGGTHRGGTQGQPSISTQINLLRPQPPTCGFVKCFCLWNAFLMIPWRSPTFYEQHSPFAVYGSNFSHLSSVPLLFPPIYRSSLPFLVTNINNSNKYNSNLTIAYHVLSALPALPGLMLDPTPQILNCPRFCFVCHLVSHAFVWLKKFLQLGSPSRWMAPESSRRVSLSTWIRLLCLFTWFMNE